MERLFLSRRNLLSLLSKLDRVKEGDTSACAIVKNDNEHPVYPATMKSIMVTAIEDEDYYTERPPGEVHHKDDPKTPWPLSFLIKRSV